MSGRYRNCCFTSFLSEPPCFSDGEMCYLVYQQERCPETGALHYQGYVELIAQKSLRQLKDLLGSSTIHIERRRGTQAEAIAYCKKDESRVDGPWEFGTPKEQGRRTDLDKIYTMLKEGKTQLDVLEEYPSQYIRYARGIEAAQRLLIKQKAQHRENVPIPVHVLIGDPGVGKTRFIFDNYAREDIYVLTQHDNALWFDGYVNQKILLIDDFYGNIKFGFMLNLIDRYPGLRLPIKGGFAHSCWEKVYITSNSHPSKWYSTVPNIDALFRRFHRIYNLPEDFDLLKESLN